MLIRTRPKNSFLPLLRRLRKTLKLLRIFVWNKYRRLLSIFLFASTVLLLTVLTTFSRSNDELANFDLHFPLSREEILSQENIFAKKAICSRQSLANNVEKLTFCGHFPSGEKKIVALFEARNVEPSISFFLKAIHPVVDSVIILDDHSTDASRAKIFEYNQGCNAQSQRPLVEILLNKTGEWVREELFDRQALLEAGRSVGGTHFVLLDYDEFFSSNCVSNGVLRKEIMNLQGGESLYLPWIELWRSSHFHRVLPDDPHMNFLVRRQIVIFADDRTSHYTQQNSQARILGLNSRNSTLHVLRCPRTICPKPAKYSGPGSDTGYAKSVKRLPNCAIMEARFMNLNNVLLKAAWYEALGRVVGARDGATSGKMITKLFPNNGPESSRREIAHLATVSSDWLYSRLPNVTSVYGRIEVWRAEELLRWRREGKLVNLEELPALSRIDFSDLTTLVQQANLLGSRQSFLLPQMKRGKLVLLWETPEQKVLTQFMTLLGLKEINLDVAKEKWGEIIASDEMHNQRHNSEIWRPTLFEAIRIQLQKSRETPGVFAALFRFPVAFQLAFLDAVRDDFGDFDVLMISAGSESGEDYVMDPLLQEKLSYGLEFGSHFRMIDIPLQNMGSFATLCWLQRRVMMSSRNFTPNVVPEMEVLKFAEKIHREYRSSRQTRSTNGYSEVADLVFSLNAGRSGSKYLAEILSSAGGIIKALHEPGCPDNACSGGGALRMQNISLSTSYRNRSHIKLPMIRQSLAVLAAENRHRLADSEAFECGDVQRRLAQRRFADNERMEPILEVGSTSGCVLHLIRQLTYAETNPNFKSWIYDITLDYFPNAGYDVKVIVIRKYIAALLRSLYETGYFTKRDGYNWMETAASVNSVFRVPELKNDTSLDAFAKILSYLISAEATFREIERRYSDGGDRSKKGVEFLGIKAERLYTVLGTQKLLRRLGLRATKETRKLAGVRLDKYGNRNKKKRFKTISLAACEKRIELFLGMFTDNKRREAARSLMIGWEKDVEFEYGT